MTRTHLGLIFYLFFSLFASCLDHDPRQLVIPILTICWKRAIWLRWSKQFRKVARYLFFRRVLHPHQAPSLPQLRIKALVSRRCLGHHSMLVIPGVIEQATRLWLLTPTTRTWANPTSKIGSLGHHISVQNIAPFPHLLPLKCR